MGRSRTWRAASGVILTILLAGCSQGSPATSARDGRSGTPPSPSEAACDLGVGVAGEPVRLTMEHDSTTREYWLRLPADYDCTPRPLLVGLHGYWGSGLEFQRSTNVGEQADAAAYIGLYPTGYTMRANGWRSRITSFNDIDSHHSTGPDGPTCATRPGPRHLEPYDYGVYRGAPPRAHRQPCHWGSSWADDIGFLRDAVARTEAAYAVDPERIFLTGFSQGAQTVQSLAWRMSDLFTAASPHHGFSANGYAKAPTTPMDFFQVWGTRDIITDGHDRPSTDGMVYESADETVRAWAKAQGCDLQPVAYPTALDGVRGWSAIQYPGCSTGATVVSAKWDGPHFWGGVRKPHFETQAMLAFLEATDASSATEVP